MNSQAMRSIQSLCVFLLFVARPLQFVICDTATKDQAHCLNDTAKKCNLLPIPNAQAQSSLASIETAVAMATSQKSLTLNAPFEEQKATIDKLDGIPAAFGDFDSDHFVDMFFLTDNGHTIRALKGKECSDGVTLMTFVGARDCLVVSDFFCSFSGSIINLVPSDFTGQNRLDLLVTVKSDKNKFTIYLVTDGFDELYCNIKKEILTDIQSEPFVLDYNGDMISDFIVSTAHCNTYLWLGGMESGSPKASSHSPTSQSAQSQGFCLTNLTNEKFKFAKPHASAFLNLNFYMNDMTTDIFLNGQNEINYIYNEGHGYTRKVNFRYPEQTLRGQSAFMDMNYSGKMIHLIPVCLDKEAQTFDNCKMIGLMALHEDSKKWFNVLDPETDSSVNVNNRTLSFSEEDFFTNDNKLTVPVTLRIGDLNYDGYPDFAIILTDINVAGSRKRTFAAIYLNLEDRRNDMTSNPFKRKFKLSWLSEKVISEDVAVVTLFDLYDNGRLNLLMTKRNHDRERSLQTQSYDYYIDQSLYYSFLRVTVVTGRCTDKDGGTPLCPKRNEKEQVALGSNPHGPNACFAGPYTNYHSCSAQLTQSAHFALQLPYMVFGLGDILNVVSELKISIPNGPNPERMRQWEEDIPGSKLIIVPYPLDEPLNWYKRAYINMGIYSMISLAFLFGLCLLLTIAIYILHYRERKEDRKDHMEYKKHWL